MTPKQILQQDAFDVLKKDLDPNSPTYTQQKRALAARCASMSVKEARGIVQFEANRMAR